jgi:hypothetical protein
LLSFQGMSAVTHKEAKEGLESLGDWMDSRYNRIDVEPPIQSWEMPRKEKVFFTVYAMNLVLESDGFECLAEQEPQDVEAFMRILRRLGAQQTASFVHSMLATLKSKTPAEENNCTSRYYSLYKRDKVWLRLLDYIGARIYMRYFRHAQAIDASGGSIFNPKEWQGELRHA